jgi:hypothetical protein
MAKGRPVAAARGATSGLLERLAGVGDIARIAARYAPQKAAPAACGRDRLGAGGGR